MARHIYILLQLPFDILFGQYGCMQPVNDIYSIEDKYARTTAIGVVLCILSVVPLIIAGFMEAPDYICGMLTSLLLVLIATGVNILIRTGSVKGSYDTLLQEGEFTTYRR